jgi:glycosyltransferase involved in cell wall biosynthesis
MEKKTILAISDFGTTGIAESARLPLTHWHNKGHEIWHLALGFNGWQNVIDRKMYPWYERILPMFGGGSAKDRFGQRQILQAIKICAPDFVFTTFDAWMISYFSSPQMRDDLDQPTKDILDHSKRQFQHIAYFPLDSAVDNLYLPSGMDDMIAGFDIPVTYSRFAQEVIFRDTGIGVPFIPIAHDPKVFKPGNRKKARLHLEMDKRGVTDDTFLVGMVATNQYRKHWNEFFEVLVPFMHDHDDVMMIPWTSWDNQIMGGHNITEMAWRTAMPERIINPSGVVHSLSDIGMASLYQSLDVLLLCTAGEGAGLPPLRARACGVPALVSDNTSNTEFCSDPFEACPTDGHYGDPFGSNLMRFTTNTKVMRERLEILYQDHSLRRKLGRKGVENMNQYASEKIMPMWDQLLEDNS